MTATMTRLRNGLRRRAPQSYRQGAARELGESSPGWRRNAERKAERAQSEKAKKTLRDRAGFSGDGDGKK